MILRDGRGEKHDLGPSQSFEASLMTGVGSGSGGGGWARDMAVLFAGEPRLEKEPATPKRREPEPREPRRARIASKPPKVRSDTCRPGRHPRPPAGTRCLPCKAEAFARWKAKAVGALPLARCVYDGVMFKAAHPKRARYCSDRCRGRYEREQAVVA